MSLTVTEKKEVKKHELKGQYRYRATIVKGDSQWCASPAPDCKVEIKAGSIVISRKEDDPWGGPMNTLAYHPGCLAHALQQKGNHLPVITSDKDVDNLEELKPEAQAEIAMYFGWEEEKDDYDDDDYIGDDDAFDSDEEATVYESKLPGQGKLRPMWRCWSIAESLSRLALRPYLSDVTLSVGEEKEQFFAHRVVLAARSPVFRAMFFSKFAEASSKDAIPLPDFSPPIFATILWCMYTDKVRPGLTKATVFDVLLAAKKLQFDGLAAACVKFMAKDVTPKTACAMLSGMPGLLDEEKNILEVIITNASEAIASPAFVDIPRESLKAILASDRVEESEVNLFNAMVRWARAECKRNKLEDTAENLRKVADDLVPLIRYPLMELQELAMQVARPGLLTQPQMLELYQYLGSPAAAREKMKCSFNTKERESGGGSAKGPWEWDAKRCHRTLQVRSGDKSTCEYPQGGGSGGTQVSCLSRFVLRSGTYRIRMQNQGGWLYSVGVATAEHDLNQQLGHNTNSWGYDYTGQFNPSSAASPTSGQGWGANVMSIIVDLQAGTLGFAVDGTVQGGGVIFRNIKGKKLYLAVSFAYPSQATIMDFTPKRS